MPEEKKADVFRNYCSYKKKKIALEVKRLRWLNCVLVFTSASSTLIWWPSLWNASIMKCSFFSSSLLSGSDIIRKGYKWTLTVVGKLMLYSIQRKHDNRFLTIVCTNEWMCVIINYLFTCSPTCGWLLMALVALDDLHYF